MVSLDAQPYSGRPLPSGRSGPSGRPRVIGEDATPDASAGLDGAAGLDATFGSDPSAAPPPDVPVTDRPPGAWPHRFWFQMAVAVCVTTAVQAIRPTVTYRAIALGAGPLEIGIVQSAFSLVPMLSAIAIGRWVDEHGAVPVLRLALVAILLGSILETLADSLATLIVSQLVLGVGQILNLVSAQSLVANRGGHASRDARFGAYFTMNSIGQLIGPSAAGFIAGGSIGAWLSSHVANQLPFASLHDPNAWVFVGGSILGSLGLILALLIPVGRGGRATRAPEEEPPGSMLGSAWRVLRRGGMAEAMLVSIVVISCVDILIAWLPAYGEVAGLSVGLVEFLLSVRAGASLVSRALMPGLIRRFGRGAVLAASLGMALAGLVGVPLTTMPPVLIGLMVVAGLGLGIGQPMTISWVAERSPRRERGMALGVRIMGNRGSTLFVPTLIGGIAGAAGIGAIFVVMAAALGGAMTIALRTPFDELVEQARSDA